MLCVFPSPKWCILEPWLLEHFKKEHPFLVQDYPGELVQEGLAVASIARDDPSTLPGDDHFPRARMHRDRNAW